MNYFSYKQKAAWILIDDPQWSFTGWYNAMDRGPWIRPTGRRIVLLQDPYPENEGLIHLPQGSMTHADHWGTVLAVPTASEYRVRNGQKESVFRGVGFWMPRALLKGAARENEIDGKGSFFYPIDLTPGTRVLTIRFAGFDCLPDQYSTDQSRLRLVDYLEIYGAATEEEAA